jgi:predicted peptidase
MTIPHNLLKSLLALATSLAAVAVQAADLYPGLDREVFILPEAVQAQAPGVSPSVLFFKQQASGKKPLILFLHGHGKAPEEINQAETPSILAKQTSAYDLPFHILQPRAIRGWHASDLDALLDYVIQKYEVDESRIYVGGFSMGGAGTWTCAFESRHPIAAIFPMASGASRTEKIHEKWDLNNVKDLPVWMFHGELDTMVPFANAKETADRMKKINPRFKFTSFPDLGHKKGNAVKARDLYDWLLRYSSE